MEQVALESKKMKKFIF